MGKVFNIQRFCVDDGPGIRTVVFLSGCPLRCEWCHNPESWDINGKLFFYRDKCIVCGRCADACGKHCHTIQNGVHIFNSENCDLCGNCVDIGCGALEYSVREYTTDEVIDIVKKDTIFYEESGGGMTISGGEPFMQYDFLLELLQCAKKNNIHVCLETSGFADTEKFRSVIEYVDVFLFDYKLSDPIKHKQYTGQTNQIILKNLGELEQSKASVMLCCVIIPTINDDFEHLRAIGKTADMLDCIKAVYIKPYHELGNSKREAIGKEQVLKDIRIPDKSDIKAYISIINTKKECLV